MDAVLIISFISTTVVMKSRTSEFLELYSLTQSNADAPQVATSGLRAIGMKHPHPAVCPFLPGNLRVTDTIFYRLRGCLGE